MENLNPVDVWANIQKMRDTDGWKILMDQYKKEGDDIMTKLLNLEISNEHKYGLRDLYVYQLDSLSRIGRIISTFEADAKATDKAGSAPKHIGT